MRARSAVASFSGNVLHGVLALGKHYTPESMSVALNELDGTFRRLLASGVRVKEVDDTFGERVRGLHMMLGERRCQRCHHIANTRLVAGDSIVYPSTTIASAWQRYALFAQLNP